MRESSTYQQILREGMQEERVTGLLEGHVEGRVERRVEGVRTAIQIMGEQRFGAAMPNQQAALESIRDFDRLQLISKRVLAAANWDDLLATS